MRELALELKPINVLTGANGCGESNLYNAMLLISRAAQGQFARAVAEEGGAPSILWSGGERVRFQRRKPPRRVSIAFEAEDYGYELQMGLPSLNEHALGDQDSGETMFKLDPRVKEEYIWLSGSRPRILMMKRDEPSAWFRDGQGNFATYPFKISKFESVLSQIIEPHLYPEAAALRDSILRWRFYHHFRTDPLAPARQPQIGSQTTVLASDGSDLAPALQTILEIGERDALREAVAEAFGGATLCIESDDALFKLQLRMPRLLRPLQVRELSDGQLRFLCLCAALLSPRPPSLLALNEPESSLHPDLIDVLARLVARISKATQLWITTHSEPLANRIEEHSGMPPVRLQMVEGETKIA